MTDAVHPSRPAPSPLFGDPRDAAFSAMLRTLEMAALLTIMLILSSAPMGMIIKLQGGASPLLPLSWAAIWGAALALVLLRPQSTLNGALASWPLLLLLLWAYASISWSVSAQDSLIQSVTVTAGAVGAFAAAGIYSWRRMIEIALWMYAGLAVFTVLLALGMPSLGVMQETHIGAWAGPWIEKNSTGRHMAIAITFAMARFAHDPKTRVSSGVLAFLFLAVLLLSTSKTALLTAILGVGMVIAVWIIRRGAALALVALYGGLIAAVAAGAAAFIFREQLVQLMGRDLTLTGRTDIWESVWWRIKERPILGYGFEAFWEGDNPTAPYNWVVQQAGFRPNNAHSSWLELWLMLGLPGLILQGAYMLWGLIAAVLTLMRSNGAYLALPYLLTTLLASNVESLLFSPSALEWFFVVMITSKCVIDWRKSG